MFEALDESIAQLKDQKSLQQKLQSEKKYLELTLAAEKRKVEDLEITLNSEGRDVKKLEGLSLIALFYTILGSKEEQLKKEQQEYLLAKLKLDESREAIRNMERKLAEADQQINELGDINSAYELVLAEKERVISSSNLETAGQLVEISESIADTNQRMKELKEAINAAEDVLAEIDNVIESLHSAEGWGMWDVFGGGLISTAIKHSRIDDARSAAHQVQQKLRMFVNELRDVDVNGKAIGEIDIGGFLTFADYFFDGLIADWVVLSRIRDSLESTVSLSEQVSEIHNRLKDEFVTCEREIEKLITEKQHLVENA